MVVSAEIKSARRKKLVGVLKAKMVEKYHMDNDQSLNDQLRGIVDDVLSTVSGTNVTRDDLARIDGRCKNAKEGYIRASGYASLAKKPKKKVAKGAIPHAPASLKNDWVIMDTYEAIQADKEAIADKKRLHEIKMSVRRTLDQQMKEKEEVAKQEKAIEDKFLREQQSIMEQWNYEQMIASSMGHSKMKQEKAIRDEQCRLNAIKRKRIKDAEEKAAAHEIDVCKRELARQEQERIDRINEQKGRNVENMNAVKKQFGKREKEEREEKAEDHRLMLQMKAMMLKQEQDRKKAFDKRVAKYEEFSTKWQESGAGKEQREAELKMERKILREAAAHEAAQIKREEDDKKKLRDSAIFLQAENLKMAARKKAEEKKYEAEDLIRSTAIRKAGEAYTAGTYERAQEEKMKGKKYALQLMQQRYENARKVTKIEMGATERIMNKKMLLKLQSDPNIIRDIQNKMFVRKKMKQSDLFKYSSNLPGFSKPGQDDPA
mmetsp:Transcript_16535/g.34115  ORF Transcript_16535/g.34115 Transcript_16535/m.34115 type:complete len:489 (-) Transcript_16535:85-1551(-)